MPILILKMWREIIIAILCAVIVWLAFSKQDLKQELAETKFIHESLVKDSKLKNAQLIAQHNEQRRLDLESYANEVLNLNNRYDAALSNSNRVQQEITTDCTPLLEKPLRITPKLERHSITNVEKNISNWDTTLQKSMQN